MTPDTPTQAALPELPEPTIEAHPAELWGQNVLHDLFTADQMRAYAKKALQEACAERDALRAVAQQVLIDMEAQDVLHEWQSTLRDAINGAQKEGASHAPTA